MVVFSAIRRFAYYVSSENYFRGQPHTRSEWSSGTNWGASGRRDMGIKNGTCPARCETVGSSVLYITVWKEFSQIYRANLSFNQVNSFYVVPPSISSTYSLTCMFNKKQYKKLDIHKPFYYIRWWFKFVKPLFVFVFWQYWKTTGNFK